MASLTLKRNEGEGNTLCDFTFFRASGYVAG